jgi:hypothetical protein
MSWYNLFKIAQARYGAWISPSGEIVDANSEEGHENVAEKLLMGRFDIPAFQSMNSTDKLLERGWVRFVYDPFSVEVENKLTSTQKIKLIMLINESQSSLFTFDYPKGSGTVYIVNDARNIVRKM